MVQIIETLAFPTRENVFRFGNLDARTGVTTVPDGRVCKKRLPPGQSLAAFLWNISLELLQLHPQRKVVVGAYTSDT